MWHFLWLQDMLCSFFNIVGYVWWIMCSVMLCFSVPYWWKFHFDLGTHPKVSFVMLRVIAHISFVWHLSYGLQQLLSPCIALLLGTKQMLRIWRLCFIYMFGVCICGWSTFNLFTLGNKQPGNFSIISCSSNFLTPWPFFGN